MNAGSARDRSNAVIGAILIVVGATFLIAQQVDIAIEVTWPLWVVIPGLVIAFLSFTVGGEAGAPIAAVGTMIAAIGALLLVQETTGAWESWAYAWTVVPGGVGLGLWLYGSLMGQPRLARDGATTLLVSAVAFAVGFLFFEGVLHISGFTAGFVTDLLAPLLLVAAGFIVIARGAMARR